MEERLAPGTKTMHVKDGWNFSRRQNGDIRIHIVDPNGPEGSDNAPLAELTIPASEWESMIAGMSAHDDSARAFAMAKAFHQADPILNFGIINAVADKVDNEASKEAFLKHQAEHHAGN